MSGCRILFVDDDPRVLAGLARLLRPQRDRWEVSTAVGPEAAIAMLAQQPFDVVVSDMRMPGMDGAALLSLVQKNYPEIVRVVLSGQTDLETALRTVPVAHQFLAKPCDSRELTEALEGARRVHAAQPNEALRKAVGSMQSLPSLPESCRRLNELLAREDVALTQIAKVVEQDVGMVAKLMQLTNSPFFGARHKPDNVRDAIVYLGLNVLRNVVMCVGALSAFEKELRHAKFDFKSFQADAVRTGALAKRIATPAYAEQAFTAGLLHDVGKLVLAARAPEKFLATAREASASGRPLHEVERELNGFTHADAGAMLVSIWGFAWPTIDAIAHHCDADKIVHADLGVMDAVFLASRFLGQGEGGCGGVLPDEYVSAMGIADRMPAWEAIALEVRSAEVR